MSRRAPIRYGSARWRALSCLHAMGAARASDVGAAVWREGSRIHTIAPHGGGDYAAQMMLGRLRRLGLVINRDAEWSLTQSGREMLHLCEMWAASWHG